MGGRGGSGQTSLLTSSFLPILPVAPFLPLPPI